MAFLLAQWASSGRFDGWRGIALALALTAAAIAVRATAEPLAPASANFAPFFISSILSALFGGVWAGLVSLAAGLLAAWYLFLPPVLTFALEPGGAASLLLFALSGLVLVALGAVLRQAFHRTAAVERALQSKVAELQALMDLAPVGIWFTRGPEVRGVIRNRFAAELLRMPPDSTAALAPSTAGGGRMTHVALHQDGRPVPPERLPLQRALRGEENRNEEYEAVFADGTSVSLLSNALPIRDASGRILGAVSASLDVTALKRTEAALREAIAARELLHREADHRIKNSLQLIAATLRLQRARVKDEAAAALLEEAVSRVNAVAQAHGALQGSPDLRSVDAGAMVEDLCRFVGDLNADVEVTCTRSGDTSLDTERAIPLGLVVSELLTNAVRHAYAPGQRGTVDVRVAEAEDRRLEVEVRDRGVGMAEDVARPGSLGRDLVRTLTRRIGAEAETRSQPGEGTTVVLRLAREPAAAAPSAADTAADPPRGSVVEA